MTLCVARSDMKLSGLVLSFAPKEVQGGKPMLRRQTGIGVPTKSGMGRIASCKL